MQLQTKGKWRVLYTDQNVDIFDDIQHDRFEIIEVLKDDYRSKVYRVKLANQDLVLKIPNEKNDRYWIRFLTWFRLGEAFKNIKGMSRLTDLHIHTTYPLLAAELRNFGMVVDSWLVYKYIDGDSCLDKEEYYPQVVAKLKEMHSKNVLHGDSQIRNFMHAEDLIYVIDSNPKSAGILGFSKAYEFAYLQKSAPGIEQYFGEIKDSFLYKFSVSYDIYDRKLARFRKRVKKFLKGK